MTGQFSNSDWPPYTCVACYLYNSLKGFDISIGKKEVSQKLGIKVPFGTKNPYSLEESDNELDWGISSEAAESKIPLILQEVAPNLTFRHIPLSIIPYQMYEETIEELFKHRLDVGIGYDFSDLDKRNKIMKHVSFLRRSDNRFTIEDFYIKETGLSFEIDWATIIKSIGRSKDGFWITGTPESILTSIV